MEMTNTETLTPREMRKRACNLSVENVGRLDSWKEIALYVNRNVRTVQRWETLEAMPIHRQFHQKSGSVHAFKAEINAWQKSRTYRKQFNREQTLLASTCVAKHALEEKEQLVLRELLEAILVQLTARTTQSAVSLDSKPHIQAGDSQIVAGQEDVGSRRGKIDGNSVQSHTFLPRMQ